MRSFYSAFVAFNVATAISVSKNTLLHPASSLVWDGEPFEDHLNYGPGRWLLGWMHTPLDHNDPECPEVGKSTEECPMLDVRLLVHLAEIQPAPLGPLLIHCGGPGSDKSCILQMINGTTALNGQGKIDANLSAHYDIVGIDQRGVGESLPSLTSKACFATDFADRESIKHALRNRTMEQQIMYNKPEYHFANGKHYLDYTGTRDVAFDLDLFRRSIGSAKLNVMGLSYGTLVASTYATLFPDSVGRVIMDGSVMPTGSLEDFAEGAADAYESVLMHAMSVCDSQAGCPAGPDSLQVYTDAQANVLSGRLVGNNNQILTPFVFYHAVKEYSTSPQYYDLFKMISDVKNEVQNTIDELVAASLPVMCEERGVSAGTLGLDLAGRLGESAMVAKIEENLAKFPLGGAYISYTWANDWYGLQTNPKPIIPGSASVPAMVVSSLYDSATNYKWSTQMHQAFAAGVMVTFQGDGHVVLSKTTGYAHEGTMICERIMYNYLLSGELDNAHTTCPVRVEPDTTKPQKAVSWKDVDNMHGVLGDVLGQSAVIEHAHAATRDRGVFWWLQQKLFNWA